MTAKTNRLIVNRGEDRDRVTVRVWSVPIRAIHWTIFLATIVLSVTGFYIGRPFIITGTDPQFLMGTMRAIHQAAAWVFTAAIAARMAFMFMGNRYSRWDQFIPVDRTRRRETREAFKYYTFFRVRPLSYAGHNPLAGMTYVVVYLMLILQIFTGFALRNVAASGFWFELLGGWMTVFLHPQTIRLVHHLIMWLTWGFVVHHVYSAMLMDWDERSGLISSMISGRKRIPKDRV